MAISGNIYVYTHEGFVYVKVENCGDAATLSHNVFAKRDHAETLHIHDDHVAAGRNGSGAIDANLRVSTPFSGNAQHGVQVPAGTAQNPGNAGYRLALGLQYGQGYNPNGAVTIGPGKFLRVGFRGICYGVVQIPPEGKVEVISYADLTYRQQGNHSTEGYRGPRVAPKLQGNFIKDVAGLMMAGKSGVMLNGQLRIVPRAHPQNAGELLGWEVWFDNQAPELKGSKLKTGFTGTMVLTDGAGKGEKNAGLGLESMAVPAGGYSAMQFIRAGGDYGVEAKVGGKFRAGVRGYSSYEGKLPSLRQGALVVGLGEFEKGADVENPKFFDTAELKEKMGEKKHRVRFYQDGKLINDKLPDIVYRGMDAFQRADQMPPRVEVRWVEDAKHPGGGWIVKLTNMLPEDPAGGDGCGDKLGKLVFTGTLKLVDGDHQGKDFRKLPVHKFERPHEVHEWFIPLGTELAGVTAEEGRVLEVGTRGLGWLAKIPLPAKGHPVDTHKTDGKAESPWELWETQHERARLFPDYQPLPELEG